ncbi:MAG: DNA polymerase domain-containing protein, partial [Candidatus Nanohaloarchaea archaeon]
MELEAKIIDVDYQVEDGEVKVRCFARTEEGENVLAEDGGFLPYLYAVPEQGVDIEELRDCFEDVSYDVEGDEVEVRAVETVERVDGNQEKQVLKLYTNIPANVPKLKNQVWDQEGVKECREFDIPFYRRYLIDKNIRPTETVRLKGETLENGSFDHALDLESVKPLEDEKNVDKDSSWRDLAFDLEVYNDKIIMASLWSENFEKLLTTEEIDREFVETVESEEELIQRFVEIVRQRDVDVLTGYNTDEYDFNVLRQRAENYGLTLSLGRDGERMKFNRRGRFKGARLKGRMHLDLYAFVEHVVSTGLDSETLDLDSVAEEVLGENKDEMSWEEMKQSWEEKEELERFADYALKDSKLAYRLGKEFVPQIMELSRIVGLIPFDACRLTFGQLTENFLLREAFKRDKLAPNRPSNDERRKRQRKGGYEGGFVYTPEPGLYEDIALLDFASLYPTVMVSHNISPDTLNLESCEERFELEELGYDFCQDSQGFFPELVERLVRDRTEIKQQMEDVSGQRLKSLESRSAALKVLANSFYGYLGYSGARWYSREAAEATTFLGRQYIENTIEEAEEQGFEVVYGDSLDYSRQIIVRGPDGSVEFMEIGDFVENVENPESYETLAWDEEEGKPVFRAVKRAIAHDYEGELLQFDTNRGRTKVTPQHSVYTFEEDIKLADASELEEGDYLVSISEVPETRVKYSPGDTLDLTDLSYDNSDLRAYKDDREFPAEIGECPYCQEEYYLSSHVHAKHKDRKVPLDEATSEYSYIGCSNAKAGKIPRFWDLTSEFAWVLGFYCGDGSASTGDKQMISFGGQDKENIKRVKRFFDDKLEEELALIEDVDSRTGNKMYYYRVQRKPLVSLFVNGLDAGRGSSGKKVPEIILNGSQELKESFIQGYLEADGSREKEYDSRYNSDSLRFSTKSSYLANQASYLLKQLDLGENRYGREINDVSYKYREDKPEIKSIRNTAPRKPEFAEKEFTPARINNIETVEPTKEKVYDLEVEGEHNFMDAEGMILVHNTDSVFLRKNDLEQSLDGFLESVNSDLPEFMELELEGLFERGFFTSTDSGEGAKKKYALRKEDGEMKITGFEYVRRDWSPLAKQTQKKVLKNVLRGEVEEAARVVKDTVERLERREVPVEELKIYTDLTKPPEEYESTAPHVEAVKKAEKRGDEIEPESTVAYVITRGGGSISDRAELVKHADSYDAEYYVENQVLPVALRVLKVFGYSEGELKGEGKQSGLGR